MSLVFAEGFDLYSDTGNGITGLTNISTGWFTNGNPHSLIANRSGKALSTYIANVYGVTSTYRAVTFLGTILTCGALVSINTVFAPGIMRLESTSVPDNFNTAPLPATVVCRLTTNVHTDGKTYYAVVYNGTTYTLTNYLWNVNSLIYVEFQVNTASTGGYLIVRINGITELTVSSPPVAIPKILSFCGYAYGAGVVDDVYVATGDNTFYGPLQINTAGHVVETSNSGYTVSSGTAMANLASADTTTMVSTTSSAAEYKLQVSTSNATHYLIHQCSRNATMSVPGYKIALTQGESSGTLTEFTSFAETNAFLRTQSVLSAASILVSGDSSDVNGPYHYFGFRPKLVP